MNKKITAEYQLTPEENGNRYHFRCGVTGARFYTAQTYHAQTPQEELLLAWQSEGRSHFNRCRRCGNWVVDVAFNPLVLECVLCAPFEKEARFCPSCGARVSSQVRLCPRCEAPLYYEGEGVDSRDAELEE